MSFRYPILCPGEVAVGFSTARRWNPLSALIRRVTGATVSHAWLLYYDERLKMSMVMEAHYEFRLVPYERFILDNKPIHILHPGYDLGAGLHDVACWLGAYYDVGGLLGMLPVMLGRWLKHHWRHLRLRLRNWTASPRALFCSEAVVRVLHAAHYPGSWELGANETSPQDLLQFFLDRNIRQEPVS